MIDRVCSLIKMLPPLRNRGLLWVSGITVPTDTTDGYQTGCVFLKTDGGAGTALYINEGSVTSCDFNALTGGAGGTTLDSLTDISVSLSYTAGALLVADGDSYEEVALSGDATLASTGALTIAALAVESSMIAAGAITTGKITGITSGEIIIGVDGTASGNTTASLSGDVTMSNAGVVTIASGAVEDSMIEGLANGAIIVGSDGTPGGNAKVTVTGDISMNSSGVTSWGGADIDLGSSGTAGTVDIFPTTASRGKVAFTATNTSSGDHTLTITNAAHDGAYTYTIPNAGASTSFLMAVGGQSPVFTNVYAGADTVAGTVEIWPTSTNSGTFLLTCADSASDTQATVTMASQSGARTYTIPDAAASASFVMTVGGQSPVLTNVLAGADAVVGTVEIWPTTTNSGTLKFTCTNSASDTATTIDCASQTGARTYTIPDAGASASFLMTAGSAQACVLGTIDSGASGVVGGIDIFPSTGSRGKIAILAADDGGGDDTLTITNAAHGGAYTYTMPNAGASANFVMSEGAATVNGAKTFGTMPIIPTATVAGAGTIIGDAAAIVTGFTLATGGNNIVGIGLPAAVAGLVCIVKNNAADIMKVWPNDGTADSINAAAANLQFDMAAWTSAMFVCLNTTNWYTVPLVAS